MTGFSASASSIARGFKFSWTLDYDDVANTVTIDVTQTNPGDGTPRPPVAGEQGGITVTLLSGAQRTFDFFDLGPQHLNIVNAGPQVFTGISLRINGGGRSQGFTYRSWFNPPQT